MDRTQVSTSLEKACTIFSISYGDAVLFGSNLDHPNIKSYIWFWTPSTEEYGGVLLGYYAKVGGRTWVGYGGGMNDHGLAFDTNGLPDVTMNPNPEKPFSWATGNFWHKILR